MLNVECCALAYAWTSALMRACRACSRSFGWVNLCVPQAADFFSLQNLSQSSLRTEICLMEGPLPSRGRGWHTDADGPLYLAHAFRFGESYGIRISAAIASSDKAKLLWQQPTPTNFPLSTLCRGRVLTFSTGNGPRFTIKPNRIPFRRNVPDLVLSRACCFLLISPNCCEY